MTSQKTNTTKLHNPATTFRPDIQGLRAIAVLTVLIYHGTGGLILPGGYVGVDVFFVISGFLITSHLLRNALTDGRVDLVDFYSRRVRRILPAASVVLLFTVVGTVLILPYTRWISVGQEIVASSVYFVNWVLARNTNYLNSSGPASPVQNYWTLAVEEQFYILWPLLLVALLWARRRMGHRSTNPMQIARGLGTRDITAIFAFGAIALTILSLALSIVLTQWRPSISYFVTPTRVWELGIGAVVATLATPLERLSRTLGLLLGICGLIAILAAAVFFDSNTPFPGFLALVPTLGAAAIIIAGMSGRSKSGVGIILKTRPAQWVGNISYSLYLWHWPLLVFVTFCYGGELGLVVGLLVVAFAFVPAWLSFRFVEVPVREWPPIKDSGSNSLRFGAVLMVVTLMAGLGLWGSVNMKRNEVPSPEFHTLEEFRDGSSRAPLLGTRLYGAESVFVDPTSLGADQSVDELHPWLGAVVNDSFSGECLVTEPETEAVSCVFGDPNSSFELALVGDSHLHQWLPAFDAMAQSNNWRIETYFKADCPLVGVAVSLGEKNGSPKDDCREWNENVLEELTGPVAPDQIIVSGFLYESADSKDGTIGESAVSDGYVKSWNAIREKNIPLTVLLDTPYPRSLVHECVAKNGENLAECAVARQEALVNGSRDLQDAAAKLGVPVIDMTNYFCDENNCPAVIGRVLVYRDLNHLTSTFARSLAVPLEQELRNIASFQFAP